MTKCSYSRPVVRQKCLWQQRPRPRCAERKYRARLRDNTLYEAPGGLNRKIAPGKESEGRDGAVPRLLQFPASVRRGLLAAKKALLKGEGVRRVDSRGRTFQAEGAKDKGQIGPHASEVIVQQEIEVCRACLTSAFRYVRAGR